MSITSSIGDFVSRIDEIEKEVATQMFLLDVDFAMAEDNDVPLWAGREACDCKLDGPAPGYTVLCEHGNVVAMRTTFDVDQWERDQRGIVDGEGNIG